LELPQILFFSILRPVLIGIGNSNKKISLKRVPEFINPNDITVEQLLGSEETDERNETDPNRLEVISSSVLIKKFKRDRLFFFFNI
jgi:hypothetical protein